VSVPLTVIQCSIVKNWLKTSTKRLSTIGCLKYLTCCRRWETIRLALAVAVISMIKTSWVKCSNKKATIIKLIAKQLLTIILKINATEIAVKFYTIHNRRTAFTVLQLAWRTTLHPCKSKTSLVQVLRRRTLLLYPTTCLILIIWMICKNYRMSRKWTPLVFYMMMSCKSWTNYSLSMQAPVTNYYQLTSSSLTSIWTATWSLLDLIPTLCLWKDLQETNIW